MDEMTNEVVVSEGKKSHVGAYVGIAAGVGLLAVLVTKLVKRGKAKRAATQEESTQD